MGWNSFDAYDCAINERQFRAVVDYMAAQTYDGELDSAGILRGQKTNMYEGGIRELVTGVTRFGVKICRNADSGQLLKGK